MNDYRKNILTIDLDFLVRDIRSLNSCIPFEMVEEYEDLKDLGKLWKCTRELHKLRFKKEIDEKAICKGTLEFVLKIIESNPEAVHFFERDHDEVLNYLQDDCDNTIVNIDFHHDLGYDFSEDQKQPNPEAVHFFERDHDEVLNYLQDDCDNTIVNIDFHHDLGYDFSEDQKQPMINNWTLWGWDEGLIKSYSWIGRSTSAHPVTATIPYEYLEWRDIDVDKLPEFDEIHIIRSPEFCPKDVYNIFVNCYNNLKVVGKLSLELE